MTTHIEAQTTEVEVETNTRADVPYGVTDQLWRHSRQTHAQHVYAQYSHFVTLSFQPGDILDFRELIPKNLGEQPVGQIYQSRDTSGESLKAYVMSRIELKPPSIPKWSVVLHRIFEVLSTAGASLLIRD